MLRRAGRVARAAALVGAALLGAVPAAAVPVTFGFTAEVTSVDDPMGLFGGAFDGATIVGQYTFESTTPGAQIYTNAVLAPLPFVSDGSDFSLSSGGLTQIRVQNDLSLGPERLDSYDVVFNTTNWSQDQVPETDLLEFLIVIEQRTPIGDPPPDLLTSSDLPLVPLDLTKADEATLTLMRRQSGLVVATVNADLTTLVPEPGTALLLASGLLALGARRRRRSR